MIRHYLDSALRNFRRRPAHTAIKLLALSLGLACFLTADMIADYVRQTDRQWARADRIVALSQAVTAPGAQEESLGTIGAISQPAVNALPVDFPALTFAATNTIPLTAVAGARSEDFNMLSADPEFADIFDLAMTAGGDAGAALRTPRTALVEAGVAERLYGSTDIVGEPIRIREKDLTVGGVFTWPEPSHLGEGATGKAIGAIISQDTRNYLFMMVMQDGTEVEQPRLDGPWDRTCCTTYALLPADGSLSAAELQQRLAGFAERRVPPEAGEIRYMVTPLSAIGRAYMDLGLFGGTLDLSLVTVLNVFAVLILAIACVNFAGLATAEATTRAREIGLRKTVGAGFGHVAAQTLVEVGLLTLAAVALVLPLAVLIVAPLGGSIRLDISPADILTRPDAWISVAAAALIACLAAGAYPALVLARIRPLHSLRGHRPAGGAGQMRTVLIGAQFAAAAFLVVAVIVMMQQRQELRGRLTDPAEDPRLAITFGAYQEIDIETLRTEMLAHPAVTGFTMSINEPFRRAVTTGNATPTFGMTEDPEATRLPAQIRYVSYDYFGVTGIRLLAGRDFDETEDSAAGSPRMMFEDGEIKFDPAAPPTPAVVDVETAEQMGFSPQEALGELFYEFMQVSFVNNDEDGTVTDSGIRLVPRPVVIVGVAAGAPLEYMVEGPANYIYVLQPQGRGNAILRVSRADVAGALAHIDRTWRQLYPARAIERVFLDEAFDTNFAMFNTLNIVFAALSAIAVAIAALGLFAMASFVVQRRLREVGVRKTLGAGTGQVMRQLVWDFSKPVIAANLIAWPLAWLAARMYLNLFVTRIPVTPLPFLAGLAVTLLIAWIAVGGHAWRAARVKPANVLKYE